HLQGVESTPYQVRVLPDFAVDQAERVNVEDLVLPRIGGVVQRLAVLGKGRLDVARLTERQLGEAPRVGSVHHEDFLPPVDAAVEDDLLAVGGPGRIAVGDPGFGALGNHVHIE